MFLYTQLIYRRSYIPLFYIIKILYSLEIFASQFSFLSFLESRNIYKRAYLCFAKCKFNLGAFLCFTEEKNGFTLIESGLFFKFPEDAQFSALFFLSKNIAISG